MVAFYLSICLTLWVGYFFILKEIGGSIMKKILWIFVIGFLITLPNSIVNAEEVKLESFPENDNLTNEQIQERFNAINSSYEIGQPFNESDTEFIKKYADPAPASNNIIDNNLISPLSFQLKPGDEASKSFNVNKTNKNGIRVVFSGKVTGAIGVVNHKYGGNITATITSGQSKVSKMKVAVTHRAYGIVGSGGTYIGLVHESEIPASKTGTTVSVDKVKYYGAVGVAYTQTSAYVDVSTTGSNQNFNLYSF